LFCFAVSQRHVLAGKSLGFHMNLFRMMIRQRRVSFSSPGARSRSWMQISAHASEVIRFAESALFRGIPKIFYSIVRNCDFAVLPRNDVAQRRGEPIL